MELQPGKPCFTERLTFTADAMAVISILTEQASMHWSDKRGFHLLHINNNIVTTLSQFSNLEAFLIQIERG